MTRLASLARRIWDRDDAVASLARAALLPAAALYRVATLARNAAYDLNVARSRPLPLVSLGVGNLAVGGAGKTPVAAALAAELKGRGLRPAVLLRGYGGDEQAVHERLVPGVPVIADPDRRRGSAAAAALGADVLVLDDALQHRRVRPYAMLAVVAAETWRSVRWPLPAGPWREGIAALARASAVVVTVKTASSERAVALAGVLGSRTASGAGIVVSLEPAWLESASGNRLELSVLAGRRVLAVSGVGNPGAFIRQLECLGAQVTSLAFGDHHRYTEGDVHRILAVAPSDGLVVTTVKDAVKLERLWPAGQTALLVVRQAVRVRYGEEHWESVIERVATAARNTIRRAADAPSASER